MAPARAAYYPSGAYPLQVTEDLRGRPIAAGIRSTGAYFPKFVLPHRNIFRRLRKVMGAGKPMIPMLLLI